MNQPRSSRTPANRSGSTGKIIALILAMVTGIVGLWGWAYFLMSTSQGGGLSSVAAPFFMLGLLIWLIFWGASVGIIAGVFGKRNRATQALLLASAVMVIVAIVVPGVASL